MKILVTGGSGFIGSHLCDALLLKGHEVISYDNLSTGSISNLKQASKNPNFQAIEGDILDSDKINSFIEGVDGVFHFAAAVGVKKILDKPLDSLLINIKGTENVLLSAAKHGKRVMLASSSEIYGKNTLMPLTEESDRVIGSPLIARWAYSEAKAVDESLAYFLHKEQALEVQIVRLFNTVGPRQSPSYGMVIPRFFEAALNGKPLTVFGDGKQQRVFGHISDVVNGVLSLWYSNRGIGEAFNIGGFEETNILSLAERIISITKSQSRIEFQDYHEMKYIGFEDLVRRIPDTRKLTLLTKWKATKSLEDILIDYSRELSLP